MRSLGSLESDWRFEMVRKRYSVEQIVAKLREAKKLEAQGLTVSQRCKRSGISGHTFLRWRIRYSALKEDEAQRQRALEQENSRLKRIHLKLACPGPHDCFSRPAD
ncbi:MAG TPA: transposase, partial [Solirubrobacteraceae bacterium]|nr:transposase [Solirubrobacteraceae bacterium]